ncbi:MULTISPECIES: cation:proton antiporter [unclassified Nitratiruptor]|uniref:cation:proton antiporter n=1 Tax=unclassified Nitratiruptor TaxID=2624044 RepID=UPI001916BA21|nr:MULTISPECIES: cation:proton antiporter [unclassified Nitratiruptor]BCD60823.1 monovalent cation:H+ antiporter-2, CPA2 family [Nitratiruptor sp. YY08-10]BCD64755.1 monovalent cation:H+ antiporter-2, CPA2 family [Nitratiruptor sp. YY08-14]
MQQIAIILGAIFIASVINIIIKRFDFPTIIGYIFTGVIVAEFFHLNVHNTEILEYISEFGIVLLMFTIGLEFSFRELKIMKKEVFLYGTLQVTITGLLFSLLASLLFSLPVRSAIIIGFALALSSTAIILKILNENGEIHAGYGRKALGILLFQDIAVIPLLLMIEIFTKDVPLHTLLIQTLLNMILFFLLLYILGKYFIDTFLQYAVATKTQEIFLLAVFFVILLSAAVAHYFGFSYSLGAFFAGMLLAESHYKYQIEADLSPFRDLLLGIFFFSVGNRIDLSIIANHFVLIALLLFGIMLLKALIAYGILILWEQKRTAFKTALTISQVGEFALALFVMAYGNRFIDETTLQIVVSVVVLSMIATPFILKNLKRMADTLFKEPERELIIEGGHFQNHIIVCGYGPLGKEIAKALKEKSFQYIIVEHDLKLYEEGIQNNEPIFFGNAAQRNVLQSLDIKEACAVVITFHNLEKIRLVAQAVLDMAPKAHLVARVRDEKEKQVLEDLSIADIVVGTQVLSKEMMDRLFYCHI